MMKENASKDMRLLFTLDRKDYSDCTHVYRRDSARGIIIKGNQVAMIHSLKYDYYKFPGGGIEAGEEPVQAMIREVREEAGLNVIPETIKPFGIVHRVQKSTTNPTECFLQDNYYFLCEAEDEIVAQNLDDYEAEEAFRLEFVDSRFVIEKNRGDQEIPFSSVMKEREARVLEMLIAEDLIS